MNALLNLVSKTCLEYLGSEREEMLGKARRGENHGKVLKAGKLGI